MSALIFISVIAGLVVLGAFSHVWLAKRVSQAEAAAKSAADQIAANLNPTK